MKIYLSTNQPENTEYRHISSLMSLNESVLDCEAKDIVVENFLSEFSQHEIQLVLNKIFSKMRLNGTLTIIENDIDILYMRYDRGDIDLQALNNILFGQQPKKSFLNIEYVKQFLSEQFKIEQSSVEINSGKFFIKVRRSENA